MAVEYVVAFDDHVFVIAEVMEGNGAANEVSFDAVAEALAEADADVSLNGQRITDLDDPGDPQDAATKQYVDDAIAGVVIGAGEYKGSLIARDNNGTSAYPTSSDFTIARSSTFIKTAVQDGDSVRFFSGGTAGLYGRCKNVTAFFVDLYPLLGGSINANGTNLGVNTPLTLAPGLMLDWMIDDDGVFHCNF